MSLKAKLLLALVVAVNAPKSAVASSFSFSLLPSGGTVSGIAGSTVGWGYSITNGSSTLYLVTTSLNADLFTTGSPLALFDFPVVAPGATVTESFVEDQSGLFELTFGPNVLPGATDSGLFDISADLYTADPLSGGAYQSSAGDSTAAYEASAVASSSPVPEPSTVIYSLLGFAFIWFCSQRVRHAHAGRNV